jgi:hypothetical protein
VGIDNVPPVQLKGVSAAATGIRTRHDFNRADCNTAKRGFDLKTNPQVRFRNVELGIHTNVESRNVHNPAHKDSIRLSPGLAWRPAIHT